MSAALARQVLYSTLPPPLKATAAILACDADAAGVCVIASAARLEGVLGLERRQVQRHVRELRALGVLVGGDGAWRLEAAAIPGQLPLALDDDIHDATSVTRRRVPVPVPKTSGVPDPVLVPSTYCSTGSRTSAPPIYPQGSVEKGKDPKPNGSNYHVIRKLAITIVAARAPGARLDYGDLVEDLKAACRAHAITYTPPIVHAAALEACGDRILKRTAIATLPRRAPSRRA